MSVEDAIAEGYATQPAGFAALETLQFDHVTFGAPVRVITGAPENKSLPLVFGGSPVEFRACEINVTPPGMSPDGPTPMRIRVDNIASLLLPYLRGAIASTTPVIVTYRAYATTDLTKPGETYSDLELRDVDLPDASAAEGTVGFREIELQAYPLATYDEQYYPTLSNNT